MGGGGGKFINTQNLGDKLEDTMGQHYEDDIASVQKCVFRSHHSSDQPFLPSLGSAFTMSLG